MNTAPFYIGQRVVALKTSTSKSIRKPFEAGKVYTVRGLNYCCMWSIDIGARVADHFSKQTCYNCRAKLSDEGGVRWCLADLFAPLQEIEVAIPASLKEQAEDLINIQETISNPEPILQ